ncbi:MAG: winged helix-turn-helix transcriptional regulator [Armatimonadetes bacterium]|nr:winged helix-turn-helix transcriptional regulator [Armatimonadota bacterium]
MDELTRIFKALADPTRARIVAELADGGLCVGALAYRLGVTHSAVSQHLRILREAGLVDGERQGYRVHYSLQRDRIREVSEQVTQWMGSLGAAPARTRSEKSGRKIRQSKGEH